LFWRKGKEVRDMERGPAGIQTHVRFKYEDAEGETLCGYTQEEHDGHIPADGEPVTLPIDDEQRLKQYVVVGRYVLYSGFQPGQLAHREINIIVTDA
jgi:hypothetical protein